MPDRADAPPDLLRDLLDAALASVRGRRCVAQALAERPIAGPVWLIALGKAAQSMAEGAVDALGAAVHGGLVVSKAGHLEHAWLARQGLTGMIAGHPVPNQASLAAGESLRTDVPQRDDLNLLFLLSGGTSSLVECPIGGLGLAELQQANQWLLASGLPIASINSVRKALSRIKGGGLLGRLGGRRLRALAISDVAGDDPAVIGSGLLVPDADLPGRLAELDLPDWLRDWTQRGLAERGPAAAGASPQIEVVATLEQAKQAAAAAAEARAYPVHQHARFVCGEAGACGAALARTLAHGPSGVHVWGGETTVELPPNPGRGGRNQHLALAAARTLSGRGDCWLLSAGTDGTDGPTAAAGALVDGATLARAQALGLEAGASLAKADAGTLLAATGALVETGPTGTNVMDLMLGLKWSEGSTD